MKKIIIISIIAIIIVLGIVMYIYIPNNNNATNKSQTTTTDGTKINNTPPVAATTTTNLSASTNMYSSNKSFSKNESDLYYSLETVAGDCGLPSASLITNLDNVMTENGISYYKVYNYATRSDYNNDNSSEQDGNYSHMLNVRVLSTDGKSLSPSDFKSIDFAKLTNEQKTNSIFKIAAQYVEGYTANYPGLKVEPNDNYEGNLNNIPDMQINLNNTKQINGQTLYQVIVSINNYDTPIYVGLDGFIYISSPNDFYKIFFPNKIS